MGIRILLVDDHQILREGLRKLLESQEDMEVVAEATDGLEAVRLAQEKCPDVVIIDIGMSGIDGIEATRRMLQKLPTVKVLALSMHLRKVFIREMLKAGAVGYILKESAFGCVIEAIQRALEGERYLSPQVLDLMADDFAHPSDETGQATLGKKLSARDCEIIRLLAEGKASKEIAALMGLSVKTIDANRRRIMDTLQVRSIAGIVKYAIREGLTTL